jgi:hypothetical protein
VSPATETTIDSALTYDPGAIKSPNGHSKYAGLTGGEATIADLRSGLEVFRGKRALPGNLVDISLRVATFPEYATPGSLSCQIVLSVI